MEGYFGASELFQEKIFILRQSIESLAKRGIDAGTLRELSGHLDTLIKAFATTQEENSESKLYKGMITNLRKENAQLKKAEKFVAQMEVMQQQIDLLQGEKRKLQEQIVELQKENKNLLTLRAEYKALQEKLQNLERTCNERPPISPVVYPNRQELEAEQIAESDLGQVENAVSLSSDEDVEYAGDDSNRSFPEEQEVMMVDQEIVQDITAFDTSMTPNLPPQLPADQTTPATATAMDIPSPILLSRGEIEKTTVLSLPARSPVMPLNFSLASGKGSALDKEAASPLANKPVSAKEQPMVANKMAVAVPVVPLLPTPGKAELADGLAHKRSLQTSILPIMGPASVQPEIPPLKDAANQPPADVAGEKNKQNAQPSREIEFVNTTEISRADLAREEEEILVSEAEVLNVLQIEMPKLEELVNQGKLTPTAAKDKSRKFKLKEVEKLRKQAMELDTVTLKLDSKKTNKKFSGRFKPYLGNDTKI